MTFSQTKNFGYIPFVASLISLTIRTDSKNRLLREPARPFWFPATDKSWQGLPAQIMSTGGTLQPLIFVTSPNCSTSGKWAFETFIGKSSISLDNTGFIPFRCAAMSHPPIPPNRLANVSIAYFLQNSFKRPFYAFTQRQR